MAEPLLPISVGVTIIGGTMHILWEGRQAMFRRFAQDFGRLATGPAAAATVGRGWMRRAAPCALMLGAAHRSDRARRAAAVRYSGRRFLLVHFRPRTTLSGRVGDDLRRGAVGDRRHCGVPLRLSRAVGSSAGNRRIGRRRLARLQAARLDSSRAVGRSDSGGGRSRRPRRRGRLARRTC